MQLAEMPATPLVWGMRDFLHAGSLAEHEVSFAPAAEAERSRRGAQQTAVARVLPQGTQADRGMGEQRLVPAEAQASSPSSKAGASHAAPATADVGQKCIMEHLVGKMEPGQIAKGDQGLVEALATRRRRSPPSSSPRWDTAAYHCAEISGVGTSSGSSASAAVAESDQAFAVEPLVAEAPDLGPSGSSGQVTLFRVCDTRVVVPAKTCRCQESLLATLIGGRTTIPIARNRYGEIEISSASSAASFRLLAWYITAESTQIVPQRIIDTVFLSGSDVEEVLGALRMDVEYFLGSSQDCVDLNDFTETLKQALLGRGYSMGDWLGWHDAPKELMLRQLNLRPNLRTLRQVDPLLNRLDANAALRAAPPRPGPLLPGLSGCPRRELPWLQQREGADAGERGS